MKLKLIILSAFVFITSNILAQCATNIINRSKITGQHKVILYKVSEKDPNYKKTKNLIGQTFVVGKDHPLIASEGCWFAGELILNEKSFQFTQIQVQIVKGQNYSDERIVSDEVAKLESEFPVGTKVKIIKTSDKPYNFAEAMADEEFDQAIATVVISDLRPMGDGWYSGDVQIKSGKVRYFEKAKFELAK